MSKFRRSLSPYLAGYLRIDLTVISTCGMSLALVLFLQGSPDLKLPATSTPAVTATAGGYSTKPARVASSSPLPVAAFDSTAGFSQAGRLLLR